MDVLALPRFEELRVTDKDYTDNPTYQQVDKAYRALLAAQKYDTSEELHEITKIVYEYREVVR
jgi:hypothetical protein